VSRRTDTRRRPSDEVGFEFFGRDFVEALENRTTDRSDCADGHERMVWPPSLSLPGADNTDLFCDTAGLESDMAPAVRSEMGTS
jgi:hypothetical protein